MPPKKKVIKSNLTELLNNIQTDNSGEDICLFSLLPNEILLEILNYLSPADILAFSSLGSPRFFNLTLEIKQALFFKCHRSSPEQVQIYFSRTRVKYITKINFNGMFYVKNSQLTKAICKCKQLIDLSVINCGLVTANIYSIFRHCKQIEIFSWNFNEINPYPTLTKDFLDHTIKLKMLYLIIHNLYGLNETEKKLLLELLFKCSSSTNIYISYSLVASEFFPPVDRHNVLKLELPIQSTDLVLYLTHSLCKVFNECISSKWKAFLYQYQARLQFRGEINEHILAFKAKSFLINSPSFVQVQIPNGIDINTSLTSHAGNSLKALSILLEKDFESFPENGLINLQRICGSKLKYLSVQDLNDPATQVENCDNKKSCMVRDVVSGIFLTCYNITVLNLINLHFGEKFPSKALCCLKMLEVINLPSCSLQELSASSSPNNQQLPFEEVVTSCSKVKHFSLHKCAWCSCGPQDNTMMCLVGWTKLRHLTLSGVVTFRTCNFLKHIANKCTDLRALELIEIGNCKVCHYIPNVIYLLKKAVQIQFLRINQKAFFPWDNNFWNAIACASNLEGLCISYNTSPYFVKKKVIDAISELKCLHLFHLRSLNFPENLFRDVKRCMLANKVQVFNVIITYPRQIEALNTGCEWIHFSAF